jgi:hypothetical protein
LAKNHASARYLPSSDFGEVRFHADFWSSTQPKVGELSSTVKRHDASPQLPLVALSALDHQLHTKGALVTFVVNQPR